MSTNEPRDQLAADILAEIMAIKSLRELEKLVGEITPQEQALLDSIDPNSPPTQEELQALGPDFVQRVQERMMKEHPGQ